MRSITRSLLVAALVLAAISSAGWAADLEGTVKIGGVFIDEDFGDLASVQETYNIYDGFQLTQIRLGGRTSPRTSFLLDLVDLNQDSRKAFFNLRVPTTRFYGQYDQNRWVFDPQRTVTSLRKDGHLGLQIDPVNWLGITATYNIQDREGDRLGFPAGVESPQLGPNRYDFVMQIGRVEAQFKKDGRVLAVAGDVTNYRDNVVTGADRNGYVLSARLFVPGYLTDKLTHALRGAIGQHDLSDSDLRYKLQNFQYTGVFVPDPRFELKYNFYGSRIDDNSTGLETDNVRNDINLTYRSKYGSVWGGYGYETNDDQRSLTDYNIFRVGGTLRLEKQLSAKLAYASRNKNDTEKRTLLKDIDAQRLIAKLDYRPIDDFTIGVKYLAREREMPDIGVSSEGEDVTVYGRYYYEYTGDGGAIGTGLTVDYTYADNDYVNTIGTFQTKSNFVGARLDIDYRETLSLGGGVRYHDVGGDLDIEKSILTFDLEYTFREDYHLELKYNVYNYDDYLMLSRYYTGNFVWLIVGYDFAIE